MFNKEKDAFEREINKLENYYKTLNLIYKDGIFKGYLTKKKLDEILKKLKQKIRELQQKKREEPSKKIYIGEKFIISMQDIFSIYVRDYRDEDFTEDIDYMNQSLKDKCLEPGEIFKAKPYELTDSYDKIIIEYIGKGFFKEEKSGIVFLYGMYENNMYPEDFDKTSSKENIHEGYIDITPVSNYPHLCNLDFEQVNKLYRKLTNHPLIIPDYTLTSLEDYLNEIYTDIYESLDENPSFIELDTDEDNNAEETEEELRSVVTNETKTLTNLQNKSLHTLKSSMEDIIQTAYIKAWEEDMEINFRKNKAHCKKKKNNI